MEVRGLILLLFLGLRTGSTEPLLAAEVAEPINLVVALVGLVEADMAALDHHRLDLMLT